MVDWVESRPQKRALKTLRPESSDTGVVSGTTSEAKPRRGRLRNDGLSPRRRAGGIPKNKGSEKLGHYRMINSEMTFKPDEGCEFSNVSQINNNNNNNLSGDMNPKRKGNNGSRAVDNLLSLMKTYRVQGWQVAFALNLGTSKEMNVSDPLARKFLDTAFGEWIKDYREREVEYFPRLTVAPLAKLLADHGADELTVYRLLMVSRGAGSLAWLLQSRANLPPAADQVIARALGLKNKWRLINLYRDFRGDTHDVEFTVKLAKYLSKNHGVPESVTHKTLLGVAPAYDTVAADTTVRVPILEREDWLSIDWESRGDTLSDIEEIMAELLARPGMQFEKIDESETNSTSVMYRVEDDVNAPYVENGARVQIDLAQTKLEPDCYYLIILQTEHGRKPLLRKYVKKRGGAAFVSASGIGHAIPASSKLRVAGMAWLQITNSPFRKP